MKEQGPLDWLIDGLVAPIVAGFEWLISQPVRAVRWLGRR
jgi:hypothetical protein